MKKLTLIVLMLMLMAAILPLVGHAQDTTDDGAVDSGEPAQDDGTVDDGAVDDGGATDDGTVDDGTADDGGEPQPEQEQVLETTEEGKTLVQEGNTYTVYITEASINALFGGVVPNEVQQIYLDLVQGQINAAADVKTDKNAIVQFSAGLVPQWSGNDLSWLVTNPYSSTGEFPGEVTKTAQSQFTTYLLSAGLADLQQLPANAQFVSMELADGMIILTFTV